MKKLVLTGWLLIGWALIVATAWAAGEGETAQGTAIPPVVAKVNGQEITAEDYLKAWRQMGFGQGGPADIKDPKERQGKKEQVMDRLIALELLMQKTDQMKIQVTPELVEQTVKQMETQLGGKDALDKGLEARGVTREEYMAEMKKSLRIQGMLKEEVLSKITVEPKEVKEFYDSNPEAFKQPEEVKARHIIIRVPKNATDEQRKEAKEAIDKAAKRIKDGESFEAVAKEVSQDAAAPRGGDLGYFARGRMVPQFEQAAFSLEKGQVSDVVETRFGYHLIQVEDKRPARTVSLEESTQQITMYLQQRKQAEGVQNYIEGLKAQAKIEETKF